MKLPADFIFQWPQKPPLPPLHQPVLVRVATSRSRKLARQELRAALRELLAFWSGLPPKNLPLQESPRGPIWPGQLAGHSLDISLSYGENEGWIGLFRGGAIGIDALPIAPIPEAEDIARHYLGPMALADIQQSKNPARAFALAWTSLEARLKCSKLELSERNARPSQGGQSQPEQSFYIDDCRVVTVATARKPVDRGASGPIRASANIRAVS